MESYVFKMLVLKLCDLERLYCSINEEVIDCDLPRYSLLSQLESAILSLQFVLHAYLIHWTLNFSKSQERLIDRVLHFSPLKTRLTRESRWFK